MNRKHKQHQKKAFTFESCLFVRMGNNNQWNRINYDGKKLRSYAKYSRNKVSTLRS